MNECALASRTLVLRFGCFVALSSPWGISFVYWKIFKLVTWNLQKVIWNVIRCHSKTISCNIKWLYRKKYEHLCSILCWIFTTFAKISNPLLCLKEGLCHLAITYKSIIQHKIPWGCSCAIYKVSSIDVRSRWIIRLRDMTPSLKKYRVIKVVLQHDSDSKLIIIRKFSWRFQW